MINQRNHSKISWSEILIHLRNKDVKKQQIKKRLDKLISKIEHL
ncbi:unnamed protein product (macronuclear) [Paramecium tetraurelia]|uniref:Uncharacterized protein n=1 Tax=Paramecium tetraurelia TaxID=5888 RepID=A0CU24_PARTE|nr:uncharacterized protein GSPATT00010490001 [Paramecium tetraurelia]CAK74291.1 unnamed protein product [Paramecium tetraurelia]